MKKLIFIFILLIFMLIPSAYARIKLVAVPQKAELIVRLDRKNQALVQEERILSLQKGINKVDFSFRGVAIDTDSIRLLILTNIDKVTLLNVSYPAAEEALVWSIFAKQACQTKIRIAYLLAGIDRLIEYNSVINKDETSLNIAGYVILRNFSGQKFNQATFILDAGKKFKKNIENDETKKVLFLNKSAISINKIFEWDAKKMPWDPDLKKKNVGIPVFYTFKNSRKNGFSDSPISSGKIRVYQKDGHGSTIFAGEDTLKFTPVNEKVKIKIGESRDIVITQKLLKREKIPVKRNYRGKIILFNIKEKFKTVIENFKDKPARILIREYIKGEWEILKASHKFEKKDYKTIEIKLNLKPKEKVTLTFSYLRKNLRNSYY